MTKAIIIDDEPLARSLVREYLQSYPDIEIAAECNDGFEGVKAIQQFAPDMIFLDIQMPKINGFEMLELLDDKPGVIFTTAFDEYAIKAFEARAIDYLLKPFSRERFDMAMQKWINSKPQVRAKVLEKLIDTPQAHAEEQNRIVVKNGNKIRIIPVHDIFYLEAYDDYVKIYTADGYQLKKKTMSHYEKILNPSDFIRVHRSYILNIKQITRIDAYDKTNHIAILKDGAKIPLSRTGYLKLKEVLGV